MFDFLSFFLSLNDGLLKAYGEVNPSQNYYSHTLIYHDKKIYIISNYTHSYTLNSEIS